jgi:hypothetical protein
MGHTAIEARSAPVGVAADVAVLGQRGPAAGALETDDARRSITFQPSELAPWQVRFDFLVYYVESDAAEEEPFYEYVRLGHELAKPISIGNANAEPVRAAQLFAAIEARFLSNFASYSKQAELLLRGERGELEEVRHAFRAGRAHKHHGLLVSVYRSLSGAEDRITVMAKAFSVHRTTIWRELRTARDNGYIDASELDTRPAN